MNEHVTITKPAFELVLLHNIDLVWPHISKGIDEACRRCGNALNAAELFDDCRSGRALLFAMFEKDGVGAGLVAQVEQWGDVRVLNILAATGAGMNDWVNAIIADGEWTRHLGCQKLSFIGRKGWQRVIPNARVTDYVYEVDMT